MSNALDGVDPTGTDLGHCAYLEWSRQTATIFLDGYYHVHAVTMYNKNGKIIEVGKHGKTKHKGKTIRIDKGKIPIATGYAGNIRGG